MFQSKQMQLLQITASPSHGIGAKPSDRFSAYTGAPDWYRVTIQMERLEWVKSVTLNDGRTVRAVVMDEEKVARVIDWIVRSLQSKAERLKAEKLPYFAEQVEMVVATIQRQDWPSMSRQLHYARSFLDATAVTSLEAKLKAIKE